MGEDSINDYRAEYQQSLSAQMTEAANAGRGNLDDAPMTWPGQAPAWVPTFAPNVTPELPAPPAQLPSGEGDYFEAEWWEVGKNSEVNNERG